MSGIAKALTTGLATLALCLGLSGCGSTSTKGPHIPTVDKDEVDPDRAGEMSDIVLPVLGAEGPASKCKQHGEAPIQVGRIGRGSKWVRVANREQTQLRVRLLTASGRPAHSGTLIVPPLGAGSVRVPAGRYYLRYRDEASCNVVQDTPFRIMPTKAGVTLNVRFSRVPPEAYARGDL